MFRQTQENTVTFEGECLSWLLESEHIFSGIDGKALSQRFNETDPAGEQMNVARCLIGFVGLLGIGGLLADYVVWTTARQHMKNPAWPPHAKFHNAQTILLGIGLGIITVGLVTIPTTSQQSHLIVASCTASLYWLSMLVAPAFPGTAWVDPEFSDSTPRPVGLHPQHILAIGLVVIVAIALGLGLVQR